MSFKPLQFGRDVRSEMRKVTWPDSKTTRQITIAVFALVIFISLFLLLADTIISSAIRALIVGSTGN